jgi:CelD/BcsL family acetyltransferase involved in cellulose biosynthesis
MKSQAVSGRAFAVVEVHHDAAAVLAIWEELEALAPISIYQTRAFLIPWLETLGAARKIVPLFIAAKDRDGRPVMLLCLGIRTMGPLRIGSFLGDKATNFDMPLWRPGVVWTRNDVEALLHHAVSLLGAAAPDVFALREQPFEWRGCRNPFALLPHQPSPNVVPAAKLEADSKKYFASRLSANARKKLRQHEMWLTDLRGPVEVIRNDTAARADSILVAFFAQRIARFRERGIEADFSDPAMQAFWTRLARPSAAPGAVEFYALTAGGHIVATIAGAAHAGSFSAVVNSIDMNPEIARFSPGTLLFSKLIALQCDKAVEHFDCGPGEANYKMRYCDQMIDLFDVFVPVRLQGMVFAGLRASGLQLKRAIKQNPRLFETIRGVKRRLQA